MNPSSSIKFQYHLDLSLACNRNRRKVGLILYPALLIKIQDHLNHLAQMQQHRNILQPHFFIYWPNQQQAKNPIQKLDN